MPVVTSDQRAEGLDPNSCNVKFSVRFDNGEKMDASFENLRPSIAAEIIELIRSTQSSKEAD